MQTKECLIRKSHRNSALPVSHKENKNDKKRAYNEQIIHVVLVSFTPLVFFCYGREFFIPIFQN